MSEADRMAYENLYERVRSVAEKYRFCFFPHTPKGYLAIGPNNNMVYGVKKAISRCLMVSAL